LAAATGDPKTQGDMMAAWTGGRSPGAKLDGYKVIINSSSGPGGRGKKKPPWSERRPSAGLAV